MRKERSFVTMLSNTSRETLHSILAAGVLAPSADNHHLFRFSVQDDRVSIRFSEAYRQADASTRLLAWISYGAVAENIRIQASALGYRVELSWFPHEDVACEVKLREGDAAPDPLAAAIPLRHTNRRLFTGPPLQMPEQLDLERQLSVADGVRLIWLDRPDLRHRALRLIRIAETERFRSRELHEQLFSSLRFDVGYKATCERGIPIGAAELERPARPFFRLMSQWQAMRLLNVVYTYWLVGLRAAYLPARLSPHLGLLVAEGDLRPAAAQTGIAFERIWLRATQMGLALQPLAAAPLYAVSEVTGVSPELREELRAGWAAISPERPALMLFRLGRASAPSVRAGRPPLSHFMNDDFESTPTKLG
jgi:hypothetical protein